VIREHDSDTPTTRLGAVVHVADRLVRRAGDRPLAEARLEALLAAQDRFDAFQG
jgi:hypothetical protein